MSQTIRSARVIALVGAVLALSVGVSVAQPRQDGRGAITVSDDVNFQGPTLTFRNDVPDLRAFQFNDRISSLVVDPGDSWEVCEDTNYGGRCLVVSGAERDLRSRGFNDIISSMRRVQGRESRDSRDDRGDRGEGGITVSDDVNFQGPTMTFRRDVPDLREFQFNDRISSLQVAPGDAWEVCEDANYGGRCLVVTGAERDLRTRGLNDAISSMRRVQVREGRGDRR
jgi:Beta/Gamma crystallin